MKVVRRVVVSEVSREVWRDTFRFWLAASGHTYLSLSKALGVSRTHVFHVLNCSYTDEISEEWLAAFAGLVGAPSVETLLSGAPDWSEHSRRAANMLARNAFGNSEPPEKDPGLMFASKLLKEARSVGRKKQRK